VGDTSEIVKKYNSGVVVDEFNTTAYNQAIDEIEKLHFEPDSLRKGALDYFDLATGVERYASVYEKLMDK